MNISAVDVKPTSGERMRLWRLANPERAKQLRRDGYEKTKALAKSQMREYYKTHKENCKANALRWSRAHRERRRVIARTCNLKNRLKYNVYRRDFKRKTRATVRGKLESVLRTRLYQVIGGYAKCETTLKLVGCSMEFLRGWLESRFRGGMSWENYGYRGWHIDHIKPCASFDLSVDEQQKLCFHYTNLQPLWASENLKKGSKYGQR